MSKRLLVTLSPLGAWTLVAACGGDDSTSAQAIPGDDASASDDGGAASGDGNHLADSKSDRAGDSPAGDDAPSDAPDDASWPPPWSCLPPYKPFASRDAAYWPFASDSPWNTPMGDGAQFENKGDGCTQALTSSPRGMDIAAHEWSQPIWIATSADPLVNLTQQGSPFASGVHCPSAATPALPSSPDTDGNLNIVDPTHHTLDESWRATKSGTTWDAQYWFAQDLYGPGCTLGGIRAYGGSTAAGLVRVGEFENGIHHALGFAIDTELQKNAWVWPAISNDGHPASDYKGPLPMGQFAGIPPSVDICKLSLSAGGLAFARALQDYGAYLVDSSGGLSFYAEPPIEDDPKLGESQMLTGARNDLATIMGQVRCVTNSGPKSVGGGGLRRAPPAPPL